MKMSALAERRLVIIAPFSANIGKVKDSVSIVKKREKKTYNGKATFIQVSEQITTTTLELDCRKN